MPSDYAFSYNGYAFDHTPDLPNGITVMQFDAQESRKTSMADIEGADDVYLGHTFAGVTTITVTGMIEGDTLDEFDARVEAMLSALRTSGPAYLIRAAGKRWKASVKAMPTITDGNIYTCTSDFVIVFVARPVQEVG